jgi:hypothetical protein
LPLSGLAGSNPASCREKNTPTPELIKIFVTTINTAEKNRNNHSRFDIGFIKTNAIQLRSGTRRKRLRCASDIIIRCSTLDVQCWMFSLFDVRRSSFETSPYGINVT